MRVKYSPKSTFRLIPHNIQRFFRLRRFDVVLALASGIITRRRTFRCDLGAAVNRMSVTAVDATLQLA